MKLEEQKKMVAEWMGWEWLESVHGWKLREPSKHDLMPYLPEIKWNPHQDRNDLCEVLDEIGLMELEKIIDGKFQNFVGYMIFNPPKVWQMVVEYVESLEEA